LFHNEYTDHVIASSKSVVSHQIPIVIQSEIVEQKGGVPFHYDFLYVLETNYDGPLSGKQTPSWLTIDALKSTKLNDQRFANVRLLAEALSERIESGKKGPL
jgi:hypothetical protein